MGIVSSFYTRIALLSPRIEVKLRQLYWKNSDILGKFNPNKGGGRQSDEVERVDFNDILNQLKEWGVGEGSLLIVHSSYDSLQCTGLSPQAIIDELLKLVGATGTLAMPVIRTYRESPTAEERLKKGAKPPVCRYHVKRISRSEERV